MKERRVASQVGPPKEAITSVQGKKKISFLASE